MKTPMICYSRPYNFLLIVISAGMLRCERTPVFHRFPPDGAFATVVAAPDSMRLLAKEWRGMCQLALRGGAEAAIGDAGDTGIDPDSGPSLHPNKRPRSMPGRNSTGAGVSVYEQDTDLLTAVIEGNSASLPRLVARGADVNKCADNTTSESLLHLAASRGLTSCVAALLELGADVDARDRFGNAPLHDAALHGQTGALAKLVEGGAAIEASNVHGLRPLHCAAANGHAATIKVMLALGANASSQSISGATPLRWAAVRGHVSVVRILLASSQHEHESTGRANSPDIKDERLPHPSAANFAVGLAPDAKQVTPAQAVADMIAQQESRGGDTRRLQAVAAALREWESRALSAPRVEDTASPPDSASARNLSAHLHTAEQPREFETTTQHDGSALGLGREEVAGLGSAVHASCAQGWGGCAAADGGGERETGRAHRSDDKAPPFGFELGLGYGEYFSSEKNGDDPGVAADVDWWEGQLAADGGGNDEDVQDSIAVRGNVSASGVGNASSTARVGGPFWGLGERAGVGNTRPGGREREREQGNMTWEQRNGGRVQGRGSRDQGRTSR